jgi:hypothetical protein
VLDRQAEIINRIVEDERFDQFRSHRIGEMVDQMVGIISPLINATSTQRVVSQALRGVAERAFQLGSRILASRLTFIFNLPDTTGRFSSASMVPVYRDIEPERLQREHWRVRLVVTPVVTARNDMGGSIGVFAVAPAEVVPMK